MPAFTKAMLDNLAGFDSGCKLLLCKPCPHPLLQFKNSIRACLVSLVNRSNVMAALLARRVMWCTDKFSDDECAVGSRGGFDWQTSDLYYELVPVIISDMYSMSVLRMSEQEERTVRMLKKGQSPSQSFCCPSSAAQLVSNLHHRRAEGLRPEALESAAASAVSPPRTRASPSTQPLLGHR